MDQNIIQIAKSNYNKKILLKQLNIKNIHGHWSLRSSVPSKAVKLLNCGHRLKYPINTVVGTWWWLAELIETIENSELECINVEQWFVADEDYPWSDNKLKIIEEVESVDSDEGEENDSSDLGATVKSSATKVSCYYQNLHLNGAKKCSDDKYLMLQIFRQNILYKLTKTINHLKLMTFSARKINPFECNIFFTYNIV